MHTFARLCFKSSKILVSIANNKNNIVGTINNIILLF